MGEVSTQLIPTQSTKTELPMKEILKRAGGLSWLPATCSFPATGDTQHCDVEHTGTGNGHAVCFVVQLCVAVPMLRACVTISGDCCITRLNQIPV